MPVLLLFMLLALSAAVLRPARADIRPETAARSVLTDAELLEDLQDRSAVARVLEKAARGRETTVALIGGSITMGTVSRGAWDGETPGGESYAQLFFRWWRSNFPGTCFRCVNAGVGGTDSYLGVHRAERDVLRFQPDLVVIEFSVNDDGRRPETPVNYHSLVRSVLDSKGSPAVMLLLMAQANGDTAAAVHRRVGEACRLPMIPVDKVFARLTAGNIVPAEALSGDVVHPSAYGHAVTGAVLSRSLALCLGARPVPLPCPRAAAFPEGGYKKAALLTGEDSFRFVPGSFTAGSASGFYPQGWTHNDGNEPFTADLTCRTLGILWLRTIDGLCGQCEVCVDGQPAAILDGDFPNGWGDAVTAREVFAGSDVRTRRVSLSVLPGEKRRWILLGFLVAE